MLYWCRDEIVYVDDVFLEDFVFFDVLVVVVF